MRFLEQSVTYLRDTYLPRLRTAAGALREEDLWWRPHPAATSVGNLLLHLEGNVRQWILSGLGGAPERRRRSAEFAAEGGPSPAELLDALGRTVEEACRVIAAERDLERPLRIQGLETTAFQAIYHVVEHFSWHTGQVVWIAKMRAGPRHGIAFYDDARLNRPPAEGGGRS
jgi:uncharacterized damage-inducible protein DinB